MTVLLIEWANNVAHVILSRPERMNALNGALIDALVAAGQELADRRDCRAVVLSGAGRAFCSGIDMAALSSVSSGGEQSIDIATQIAGGANIAQLAVLQWQSMPMPVIAAVHGYALGGGLQLALGADIRIVARDARLGLVEVKWGMVPDMGGMVLLPDLVRADRLAELLFSGRVFDGTEAVELGIATCDKIVSSVLFEAGIAVALGKPSVYFIRERNGVPFLMRKAEQANIPAGVRIYEYAGPPQLENLLRSSRESLWKYSDDKP